MNTGRFRTVGHLPRHSRLNSPGRADHPFHTGDQKIPGPFPRSDRIKIACSEKDPVLPPEHCRHHSTGMAPRNVRLIKGLALSEGQEPIRWLVPCSLRVGR